jgi:hypothetical protein
MALVLYDHPLSPYAQKVKIALLEKGVEFEAPCRQGLVEGADRRLYGRKPTWLSAGIGRRR